MLMMSLGMYLPITILTLLATVLCHFTRADPPLETPNGLVDLSLFSKIFETNSPKTKNFTCKSAKKCRKSGGKWRPHTKMCRCSPLRSGLCCELPNCVGESTYSRKLKKCVCRYPDYQYGELCEHSRCQNGGVSTGNGYCNECDVLWKGMFCDVVKCFNLGQHSMENGEQMCECAIPERHKGLHCESLVCDHGGTHTVGDESCSCPFPFKGMFCEYLNRMLLGTISVVLISLGAITLFFVYRFRQIKKAEAKKQSKKMKRSKLKTQSSQSSTKSGRTEKTKPIKKNPSSHSIEVNRSSRKDKNRKKSGANDMIDV